MKRALALLVVLGLAIAAPAPATAARAPAAALPVASGVERSPDTAGGHRWQWPVEGPRAIARPFLAPATPYGSGHRGVDLRAGTEAVLAPAGGVVHFAGVVVDRPVLSIRHPGGLISSFEPVSTQLRAGDAVVRGQVIGTLHPGHCAGLCLHFGVRLHGQYVNPLLLLGGVPRSVLLPTR